MYQYDPQDILKRLMELEQRVRELEKIKTVQKRPYKWRDKIGYCLDVNNKPLTKGQIFKFIEDNYKELTRKLGRNVVKNRVSSSYYGMRVDEIIVFIYPKSKHEDLVIAKTEWFKKDNRLYEKIKNWFLIHSEDYEYKIR